MGMTISCAVILSEIAKIQSMQITKKRVICLGVPDSHITKRSYLAVSRSREYPFDFSCLDRLGLDDIIPTDVFFFALGYDNIKYVDVDWSEGANYIIDLNKDTCPECLINSAGLIYDTGTLEHVFNLPNALKFIHNALATNGIVLHSNPSNQMLDHGFYQICPTFYRSYYDAANYLSVWAGLSKVDPGCRNMLEISCYKNDVYRSNGGHSYTRKLGVLTLYYAAQKKCDSINPETVIQKYYQDDEARKEYEYQIMNNNTLVVRYSFLTYLRRYFKNMLCFFN